MAAWKKLEVERSEKLEDQILIYRLEGVLTDTAGAFSMLDDLRAGIRKKFRNVMIDLQGVEHLTSAGVGILAAALSSAKRADAWICVVGVSKRAQAIIELVGLWEVLPHFENEDEAMTALKGGN